MTDTQKSEAAEAFSLERLIAEAGSFLNVPSHVAAGAFHGCERAALTVAEASKRVEAWLKSPVK